MSEEKIDGLVEQILALNMEELSAFRDKLPVKIHAFLRSADLEVLSRRELAEGKLADQLLNVGKAPPRGSQPFMDAANRRGAGEALEAADQDQTAKVLRLSIPNGKPPGGGGADTSARTVQPPRAATRAEDAHLL